MKIYTRFHFKTNCNKIEAGVLGGSRGRQGWHQKTCDGSFSDFLGTLYRRSGACLVFRQIKPKLGWEGGARDCRGLGSWEDLGIYCGADGAVVHISCVSYLFRGQDTFERTSDSSSRKHKKKKRSRHEADSPCESRSSLSGEEHRGSDYDKASRKRHHHDEARPAFGKHCRTPNSHHTHSGLQHHNHAGD